MTRTERREASRNSDRRACSYSVQIFSSVAVAFYRYRSRGRDSLSPVLCFLFFPVGQFKMVLEISQRSVAESSGCVHGVRWYI